MIYLRFVRDFPWWGAVTRNCVLCKALALYDFKAGPIAVPVHPDAARDAMASGAAVRVDLDSLREAGL